MSDERPSPEVSAAEEAVVEVDLQRAGPAGTAAARDRVAVEDPLEVRLRAGDEVVSLAVTMRTPGADRELALGFLYAEGIVRDLGQVRTTRQLDDPWGSAGGRSNVLEVELVAGPLPDLARLSRHFFTSSSCGVCGRAGIESLRLAGQQPIISAAAFALPVLHRLPARLRAEQGSFALTGGLHAAAWFSREGELIACREDIGRHNALDKLLGWGLLAGRLPLGDGIVLVSGRASFEIVQKCLAAGAACLASVSAPSSLAITLARAFDLTLVGFLRDERCNVYAGSSRVVAAG